MTGVPRTAVRFLAKRVVDPLLYRLDSRYVFYRARRDWNIRAREMPRETTATFDAADWDTYWSSGRRDLELLLEVASQSCQLGSDLAVELGCGIGRITRPLAEKFRRVLGVDVSPEMVRLAQVHANAPNITYGLVGPDCKLPLPDRAADLIIAWTVFRHTAKTIFASYLNEANRVLRPNGCLAFEAQVRETGVSVEPPPYDSLTEREYSRSELQRFCDAHGLVWGAERSSPCAAPGASTLILAWRKPDHL